MTEYKRPELIELNTRDQFNAAMAKMKTVKSEFRSYTERRKQRILGDLYRIAQERLKIEAQRLAAKTSVTLHIRPRLKLYRQAEKVLRQAQKSLQKAERIYATHLHPAKRPPWIKIVNEAKNKINEAAQSLSLTIGYLSLHIHVDLVTKKEQMEYERVSELLIEAEEKQRGKGIPPECEIELLPKEFLNHVRSKLADHYFILDADSYLEKRTSVTPLQRFKIIKELFEAAFEEHVSEHMVRSVVRRHDEMFRTDKAKAKIAS